MIKFENTLRLLAIPAAWMGTVQIAFGVLSLFLFGDNISSAFFEPGVVMIVLSSMMFFARRRSGSMRISNRDALIFATSTWVVTGLLGAFPVLLVTHVSFTDAVFESVSALTTTGATILTGLDSMPPSFLMYRQFLQWMGGLGVVIFVVAVLPMLNVGGMRLLKAETPGPMKDEKLTPRIAHTAHYLWFIYVLITVLCAAAYYAAGMSFYDAVAHSFTTVSTGGFSTHDSSLWYFKSHVILAISNVFMLLGAISFALHFTILHNKAPRLYWRDEETRTFLTLVAAIALGLCIYLMLTDNYQSFAESLSFSVFTVISFITSTGYGAADVGSWPIATALLLIFTSYLGGCAGSTAGGNKIVRNIIVFKLVRRQFYQLLHPKGVFSIVYRGQAVEPAVRKSVMGFMSLAAFMSMFITLLLMSTGLDFLTAFSAVAACLNVLGPGFGAVISNFQPVSDAGIWILSATMILGRLEYLTVLALFFPLFWRQ